MKYLDRLFFSSYGDGDDEDDDSDDNEDESANQYKNALAPLVKSNSHSHSSSDSSTTIYSVAYVREQADRNRSESTATSLSETLTGENKISIIAHANLVEIWQASKSTSLLHNQSSNVSQLEGGKRRSRQSDDRAEGAALDLQQPQPKPQPHSSSTPTTSCMLISGETRRVNVDKQTAAEDINSGHQIATKTNQRQLIQQTANSSSSSLSSFSSCSSSSLIESIVGLTDDDWILVEKEITEAPSGCSQLVNEGVGGGEGEGEAEKVCKSQIKTGKSRSVLSQQQMALDKTEIDLIKASWVPVSKDPVASGLLLFKGLFTKFPSYLDFFPNFSDFDVERMHENKRLIQHAVIVINKVTLVVDVIGDDSKLALLNENLVNLVKSHLKKGIGLTEFRGLGIVLIDFICDVNQRHQGVASSEAGPLVTAWTKLYNSILDLVRQESEDSHSEGES